MLGEGSGWNGEWGWISSPALVLPLKTGGLNNSGFVDTERASQNAFTYGPSAIIILQATAEPSRRRIPI